MQTAAIRTVAYSLPQNEVILLTLLISRRYIPYTDLRKIHGINIEFRQINEYPEKAVDNPVTIPHQSMAGQRHIQLGY